MNKIGVFYSSETGKSEFTAQLIKDYLKDSCEVYKLDKNVDKIINFNKIIFIIPTYGCGIPHEDWLINIDKLNKLDFSNKTIGLIGRGNQQFFPNTFVDGMKPIYDIIIKNNGLVKGFVPIENYRFNQSKSIINNCFIGLPLDEMFMFNEIKEKLSQWINLL